MFWQNASENETFVCAFYDFELGVFSSEGVSTLRVSGEDQNFTVECTSNHLTSFAVLVNVGGADVSCTHDFRRESSVG